jgi:dihydrofolate reductase
MSSTRPEVVLIAAVALNGVIGRDGKLPWRLKADLARFKHVTTGHPVLMGRKTWESLGRPLPDRRNLVVTREVGYSAAGAEFFTSPEAALQAAGDGRVFVIGGAELYRQLFDRANVLMITEVQADVAGDTYFPRFDRRVFVETHRESHPADGQNEFPFDFVEFTRRT